MFTIFKQNADVDCFSSKIPPKMQEDGCIRDTKLEKREQNQIHNYKLKTLQKQHPIMIMATDKMTTLVEENDTQRQESSPPPSQQGEVPSGFILKLFQMVNGAPDEVIAVSSTFFLAFRNECASKFVPLRSFISLSDPSTCIPCTIYVVGMQASIF
jgi:hypothetical protein